MSFWPQDAAGASFQAPAEALLPQSPPPEVVASQPPPVSAEKDMLPVSEWSGSFQSKASSGKRTRSEMNQNW